MLEIEIIKPSILEMELAGQIPSTIGGTRNYLDLTNKPSINGVELIEDKTTEDLGIIKDVKNYIDENKEELKGEPGFSPTANILETETGIFIEITDKNGTTSAEIRNGTNGIDGKPGKDGVDGYTPIKGTDYFTEEDKQVIENEVVEDIEPILENIENIANQAETIAKGRATGYVFDTVEDLDAWLLVEENVSKLILGDNLYIRAVGVPDYWWDGTQKQVLETQKVDLSEYAKQEDVNTELGKKVNTADVGEKELLITYEDETTETIKLVIYK